MKSLAAAMLLAGVLISAASAQTADPPATAAPQLSEQQPLRPPPSRQRPPEESDEGGLWGLSDRAEAQARSSGQLERDAGLNAYVQDVACRVADNHCGDIRLYIMNRPFFNAQMAPNGYMEVWSGLLLRAEDEAQLAFVLGHEIGHFSERHSLEALRAMRARATGALVASVVIAAAGTAAAVNSPNSAQSISDVTRIAVDAVYLGTIASFFAFTRENESQADAIGFDRAVAAGYDPNAGERLWRNLIAEAQGSDNPDVRRRDAKGSIFNTHPLSADRVEALHERAAENTSAGATHRERYRAAIRPFLADWLRMDLRRRDFGQTLLVLERLGATGEDLGVVEFFRGEALRLRRRQGDRETARTHYVSAIQQPDAPAAAWRELAEYLEREGERAQAAQHLRTYLERAPDAEDRALVEARITQLEGGAQ